MFIKILSSSPSSSSLSREERACFPTIVIGRRGGSRVNACDGWLDLIFNVYNFNQGRACSLLIHRMRNALRENMKEVQKEVLIKNVSKNAPVENINRVKDAVVKHLKEEARKTGMSPLSNNQVSVTRLSWTKVNKDGRKETKYGVHKVMLNAKVEYRKLMFSNLVRTTMRNDLGDKISIKNMVPRHLLACSKHLERVALKKRREDNLHTKVALKEGGLFLYTKRKGDRDWQQVEEEDLMLADSGGELQDQEEGEDNADD